MENIYQVKASIPGHLKQFVVEQDVTDYTSEDQAVWRYSLRQLKHFLNQHAHEAYSQGLDNTGITVNEIPSIDSMCKKLQEFGWSAIPVSGFIPPAAFMELQSLSILPIASSMRTIDHINYTPAPDIVHEAAGHAPILVCQEFADYLKSYAQVAKNALLSQEDLDQYEAIRILSDTKENPNSTAEEIKKAEESLVQVNNSMSFVSEAGLLSRMNWWTAEYGLIGSLEAPKLYGAGLLSSIGEAKNCVQPSVKKIPLSIDCINYSYDITEQQPQLFVAESFEHLTQVLNELSDKLAYKRGGTFGLEMSIRCKTVNTVVLNSGLQISGKLSSIVKNSHESAEFYRFEGPTQLCFNNQQLPDHGIERHNHGFSAPLGKVVGQDRCLSALGKTDLENMGFKPGEKISIEFESGIQLEGKFSESFFSGAQLLLLAFKDCRVWRGDEVFFDPSWGEFDLAVGSKVASVFAGPADRIAFGATDNFVKKTVPKVARTPEFKALDEIYFDIRKMRRAETIDRLTLDSIILKLNTQHPNEWLPRMEILELISRGWVDSPDLKEQILDELNLIKDNIPNLQKTIVDGIEIATYIY